MIAKRRATYSGNLIGEGGVFLIIAEVDEATESVFHEDGVYIYTYE